MVDQRCYIYKEVQVFINFILNDINSEALDIEWKEWIESGHCMNNSMV
jgi:hypothetical protein